MKKLKAITKRVTSGSSASNGPSKGRRFSLSRDIQVVRNGYNVDLTHVDDSFTKLHRSCLLNETEDKIVKVIATGVNPNSVDRVAGSTPLHLAVVNGNVDNVRVLLAHGADVNIPDGEGKTPLLKAVECQSQEGMVKFLIYNRANPNFSDKETGNTPLLWALNNGDLETARLLLNCPDIDVNRRNVKRETSLHVAVRSPLLSDLVEVILDKDGMINVQDEKGRTPLMMAACFGNKSAAEILVKKGADITLRDSSGLTARDLAKTNGFSELSSVIEGSGILGKRSSIGSSSSSRDRRHTYATSAATAPPAILMNWSDSDEEEDSSSKDTIKEVTTRSDSASVKVVTPTSTSTSFNPVIEQLQKLQVTERRTNHHNLQPSAVRRSIISTSSNFSSLFPEDDDDEGDKKDGDNGRSRTDKVVQGEPHQLPSGSANPKFGNNNTTPSTGGHLSSQPIRLTWADSDDDDEDDDNFFAPKKSKAKTEVDSLLPSSTSGKLNDDFIQNLRDLLDEEIKTNDDLDKLLMSDDFAFEDSFTTFHPPPQPKTTSSDIKSDTSKRGLDSVNDRLSPPGNSHDGNESKKASDADNPRKLSDIFHARPTTTSTSVMVDDEEEEEEDDTQITFPHEEVVKNNLSEGDTHPPKDAEETKRRREKDKKMTDHLERRLRSESEEEEDSKKEEENEVKSLQLLSINKDYQTPIRRLPPVKSATWASKAAPTGVINLNFNDGDRLDDGGDKKNNNERNSDSHQNGRGRTEKRESNDPTQLQVVHHPTSSPTQSGQSSGIIMRRLQKQLNEEEDDEEWNEMQSHHPHLPHPRDELTRIKHLYEAERITRSKIESELDLVKRTSHAFSEDYHKVLKEKISLEEQFFQLQATHSKVMFDVDRMKGDSTKLKQIQELMESQSEEMDKLRRERDDLFSEVIHLKQKVNVIRDDMNTSLRASNEQFNEENEKRFHQVVKANSELVAENESLKRKLAELETEVTRQRLMAESESDLIKKQLSVVRMERDTLHNQLINGNNNNNNIINQDIIKSIQDLNHLIAQWNDLSAPIKYLVEGSQQHKVPTDDHPRLGPLLHGLREVIKELSSQVASFKSILMTRSVGDASDDLSVKLVQLKATLDRLEETLEGQEFSKILLSNRRNSSSSSSPMNEPIYVNQSDWLNKSLLLSPSRSGNRKRVDINRLVYPSLLARSPVDRSPRSVFVRTLLQLESGQFVNSSTLTSGHNNNFNLIKNNLEKEISRLKHQLGLFCSNLNGSQS